MSKNMHPDLAASDDCYLSFDRFGFTSRSCLAATQRLLRLLYHWANARAVAAHNAIDHLHPLYLADES